MKKSDIYKRVLAVVVASGLALPQVGCSNDNESSDIKAILYQDLTETEKMRLEQYKSQLIDKGADVSSCRIFSEDSLYVYVQELVIESYIVKKGDTFNELLARYSMERTNFMKINKMENEDLKADEKINVYYYRLYNINKNEQDYEIYVVRPNDNITSIAKYYNCTVDEILSANPSITNPDLIQVGDCIKIPKKGIKIFQK